MFEINFETDIFFLRFEFNFNFSKLGLRFPLNSNGFSRDRKFWHQRACYIKSKYSLPYNYYELPKQVGICLPIFAVIQTEKIEQRGIVKVGSSVARHVDKLNKFDMFEIFN